MVHPGYPPPTRPSRSGVDLAVSIVALTLTALLGAAAAFFGLFSLAFLDHCPPATCSVDGAVNAVFLSLLAAAGIGLTGMVLTIVLLATRKTGWPVAVGTLVVCAMVLFVGAIGYGVAVG